MLHPLGLCHLFPPSLSYDSADYISFWRGGSDSREILETGITDIYITAWQEVSGAATAAVPHAGLKKSQTPNHSEQIKSVHLLPHEFLEVKAQQEWSGCIKWGISVSHGEVPPHSVLPSAWQGKLEFALVLGDIFCWVSTDDCYLTGFRGIALLQSSCQPYSAEHLVCPLCLLLSFSPLAHDNAMGYGVPGVAQTAVVYSVRQFRKCVWESKDCTAKSSFTGLVPRSVWLPQPQTPQCTTQCSLMPLWC